MGTPAICIGIAYSELFQIGRTMCFTGADAAAGLSALFKGVSPAMARGLVYGGLRIGMYSPIKTWMAGEGNKVNMQTKVVAGCASGAIAAAITNPIELVSSRTCQRTVIIACHLEREYA